MNIGRLQTRDLKSAKDSALPSLRQCLADAAVALGRRGNLVGTGTALPSVL